MITTAASFERLASAVAERAADLLGADVVIADDRQRVVASNRRHVAGLSLTSIESEGDGMVHVPAQLAGQDIEVVVSRSCDLDAVPPRLAGVLVELIVNQAAMVNRLPNGSQLKNKFIHDLLQGASESESELIREAQILGMDLTVPRSVILIDAADFILAPRDSMDAASDRRIARRAQVIIGAVVDFFQLPTDTICAYIGQGEVVVLKASNRQNLEAWVTDDDRCDASSRSWADLGALKGAAQALLPQLRTHTRASITIGVGRHHPGLGGLARSYQDAGAALRLGKRFCGENQVHCLDSLGVAAFVGVADEATKVDLATYLLSPLDEEPELLETLSTYFANDLSPCQTASDLSIHRNTLTYRFNKIASLIGLDPRRFDDAIQIRLSLVLRSLRHVPERVEVAEEAHYAAS